MRGEAQPEPRQDQPQQPAAGERGPVRPRQLGELVGVAHAVGFVASTFPAGPMILRPAADAAINVARRFAWVSSFTALTTYQIAVRRYPGGCPENHAQAALLALNTLA